LSGEARPAPGSALALGVLVTLVVLSPWPFGSVAPPALAAVTACALGGACFVLAVAAGRGGCVLPALPLWPLGAFVALSLAQLAPLDPRLHAWLAPGSCGVWHPADPAAAAVLGAGAHPVSVDPATTLRAAALVAGLGLLALAAAPALARPVPAKLSLGTLAAGGFVLATYAVWARARYGPLLFGRFEVPTVSPFGPFVNKNHFAGWGAMAALLTAGLALGLAAEGRRRAGDWTSGRRAGGVVLALVSAVAIALAVVASQSRGGAAALAAGSLALVARALARSSSAARRTLVPGLLVAAALLVVPVALAPPAAQERLGSLAGADFRLATWRDTLRLAATSPVVGHGLGAFHDAFPPMKRANGTLRVEHAENEFLETLAETGALGLGLALFGFFVLLRASGVAGETARLGRGVASGAAAALVALAVHGALDFDLRIPADAALAALAAAAAAAGAGVRLAPLGRFACAVLATGAAALLAGALLLPAPLATPARDEARRAAASTNDAVRALRLARAEALLVQSLRARPADAESWLFLAWVRAARGDPSAAGLARHAAALDPARPDLSGFAARLASGPADSP